MEKEHFIPFYGKVAKYNWSTKQWEEGRGVELKEMKKWNVLFCEAIRAYKLFIIPSIRQGSAEIVTEVEGVREAVTQKKTRWG